MILAMTSLMVGCSAVSEGNAPSSVRSALKTQAEELLRGGEWYRARKITEEMLQKDPQDEEMQKLMADILEKEIAQHKEILEPNIREELTEEESSQEVKTWLERAEAFLKLGQYDEALLSSEKVFLFDPDNQKASEMIDEIQRSAYRQGKKEKLFLDEMAREEVRDRISNYRTQARQWMTEGRWGAARLAVEKILLLEPEDPEGLALYKKIETHKEKGE